jgi:LysM repeat protein
MQVAAEQASALAASEGAVGHERPCGMTLGQELLMRGYPLLGDLSMDGYRSENWVTAFTAEDAVSSWLGDAEHANTMLSPNRSDIGAAVAVSDQVYIVLETALSTSSGKMQYDAYAILTGIPVTRAACIGEATQYAEFSKLPQHSIPVVVNTALPNGDVIHEVKYGQTLWSIAIQYGTTIAQIKHLNYLSSDVISPGQKLIVQNNATQPAPGAATLSPTSEGFVFAVTPSSMPSPVVSETLTTGTSSGQFLKENGVVIVALIISFSVMLAGLGLFGKKKD